MNRTNSLKFPLISVIVPIYQVEDYLHQCIDSILMQTFTSFELLLIDDGSYDQCGKICDDYEARDSRVRVFHRKNGGLSAARNTGLDNISGAYITMVDSDDVLLSPNYLQILYDTLTDNNAEISICGHIVFEDNANNVCSYIELDEFGHASLAGIISGYDYNVWKNIPETHTSIKYYTNTAHGKLYRKELFDNVRFPEGRIFEDIAIQHKLTLNCNRIAFANAAMYGYRLRQNSIERGSSIEVRTRDMIYAFQKRIDYYEDMGHPELAVFAEQSLIRWLNKHKKITF